MLKNRQGCSRIIQHYYSCESSMLKLSEKKTEVIIRVIVFLIKKFMSLNKFRS